MIASLEAAVVGLAVAVGLLVPLIVVIRVVAGRRARRERRLRPGAEMSLAQYLAGSGGTPSVRAAGERAVLLQVALEAMADLRGSDRARLAALLERLGYVTDAASRLHVRRRAARRRAAETLSAIGTPASAPAVITGLADRDVLVRTACARTLADVGDENAVPAIIACAERDVLAAPGAVAAVVLALATSRPAALAPLLGPDAAPRVRKVAIAVTGELRLSQHAAMLRACLADRDDLSAASARGLGLIGDAQAAPALAGLACDDHRAPSTRAAAATALGSIGDATAAGVLESLAQNPDWLLRHAAAQALSRLGEPGTAALRRVARSGPPAARAQAEAALVP